MIFHVQKEPASHLRLAEVLEYDSNTGRLEVWFYIHGAGSYNVELPMSKWVATAEWYNDNNQSVVYPRPAAKSKLYMRDGVFQKEEIDLVAAGISLQRGKVPAVQIKMVDEWLKRASQTDSRASRVVNAPD